MKPKWILSEAINFIQSYQSIFLKLNYHAGLVGGVLNKGESYNDLDICLLQIESKELDYETEKLKLIDFLQNNWNVIKITTEDYEQELVEIFRI